MTDQSELTALRERAQKAINNVCADREAWQHLCRLEADAHKKARIERDAATARAERAEERGRRLVELVKEAFLQGFDAKDSEVSAPTTDISYSERAEEAWERSQAHATLVEGGGNG